MAKSIKDLKKENTFMKSKSEKSDITLIELANEVWTTICCRKTPFDLHSVWHELTLKCLLTPPEQRELLKKQLEKTRNQKDKLESLCRSLQAERKTSSVASNSSDTVVWTQLFGVECYKVDLYSKGLMLLNFAKLRLS